MLCYPLILPEADGGMYAVELELPSSEVLTAPSKVVGRGLMNEEASAFEFHFFCGGGAWEIGMGGGMIETKADGCTAGCITGCTSAYGGGGGLEEEETEV